MEKSSVPVWFLSPSLGGTDLLWFKEGWKLDPAGISNLCQPNGPWRNWLVMKLLSGDSGLPGSIRTHFSLEQIQILDQRDLRVLPEAPPRSCDPASLKVGQMVLTVSEHLQTATCD